MNNILVVHIALFDPIVDDEDLIHVFLQDGTDLVVEKLHGIFGDTASDMFDTLKEDDGFIEDLKHFYDFPKGTKINKSLFWFDEVPLLFVEQWEMSYTEYGPEQDYYAEYIGILTIDNFTEANCFKYEDKHG